MDYLDSYLCGFAAEYGLVPTRMDLRYKVEWSKIRYRQTESFIKINIRATRETGNTIWIAPVQHHKDSLRITVATDKPRTSHVNNYLESLPQGI